MDQEKRTALYLRGLKRELADIFMSKDAPEGVSSLFLGGGTPTVLSVEQLEKLLAVLHESMTFLPKAEKSIECNPGTLNPAKLNLLRRFDFNRISLGIQSMNDTLLQEIGRAHNVDQARNAFRMIREAGFANINLDLMFGLPGQTLLDWQQSLEEALKLSPEHFSLYGLTLEEGTPLEEEYRLGNKGADGYTDWRVRPILPDDDLQTDMYAWAVERLRTAGYCRYETSNFSLPGKECRHNLGYWRGADYLGLGPGAVSCRNGKRWKNVENVEAYSDRLLAGVSPEDPDETEYLTSDQRMAERMFLGLRLTEGVNIAAFEQEFDVKLENKFAEILERYYRLGILRTEDGYLKLNPAYVFVANTVLQDFV